MNIISSNWILDPPDTRDFDLVQSARSRNKAKDKLSKILQEIASQINTIKLGQNPRSAPELELVAESIDVDYPVAAAVLLALESIEYSLGRRVRYSREFLYRNCLAASGLHELDFGIRHSIKTLIRYGPQLERYNIERKDQQPNIPPVITGYKDDLRDFKYFRMDSSIFADKKSNGELFNKIVGCIRTGLPVIFSVMRFSASLNWTTEDNFKQLPIPSPLEHPVSRLPAVGFSVVGPLKTKVYKKNRIEIIQKFSGNKNPKGVIDESKLGIKIRHFVGSTIGEDEPGYAIVPEWYFHLGLIKDCWVLISPDWLDVNVND